MKRSWLTPRMMLWARQGRAPGCVTGAGTAPAQHAGLPPSRLPTLPARPLRGQWLLPLGTPPQLAASSKPRLPCGDCPGAPLLRPRTWRGCGPAGPAAMRGPRRPLPGPPSRSPGRRRASSRAAASGLRPGWRQGARTPGVEGLRWNPRPDPSLAPHTRDPRGHALHAKQRLATPTAPPQGRPAHLLGLVHVLQEL